MTFDEIVSARTHKLKMQGMPVLEYEAVCNLVVLEWAEKNVDDMKALIEGNAKVERIKS